MILTGEQRRILKVWIDEKTRERLPSEQSQANRRPVSPHEVTEGESEILALVAQGYSDKEIGALKERTPVAIRSVVRLTMTKLQAKNRAHAVGIGFERGLI